MSRTVTLSVFAMMFSCFGCAEVGEPIPHLDTVRTPVETDFETDFETGVETEIIAAAEARPGPETDYSRELAALSAQLEAIEHDASRYPGQWARMERVSSRYAQRARLTGSFDDYAEADRVMSDAFEVSPEGSGPLLSRAYLSFTLHRLPAVEPDLTQVERRVIVPDALRAQVIGLRGDVALHAGHFDEAEALHRRAEELSPDTGNAFRVAYDLWQTGQYDEAERWLSVSEERIQAQTGRQRAWMQLQRGLMDLDRGRYPEALAHYLEARALYSGWWLIDEHVAEIHAIRGENEEAERLYRDLVQRTDNPEFIDALADVLEARGEESEAAETRARALLRFEQQLAQLPEASYGHALDHFLQHGDPVRALGLARENFALRPGGEATTRLAQALLVSRQPAAAVEAIEPLLATPYRSAQTYATASLAYAAAGDDVRAAEERAHAVAIHPTIFERLDWLRE